MFFTSAQLSADPELRPITWSSPQAYQSERHYLYTQLAEALHISASSSATNSATTSTSDISNASSNLSPKSSKSNLVSSKRDSMISCSAETITTLASKKSASSLLNACSRKLVSPFLPSSSSKRVQKFKPVTFNSPQTSVFRFDTVGPTAATASASAASTSATPTASATSTSTATSTTAATPIKPSPKKVDSVMGSPIKFLSPSLFKRNNNKIMSSGAAGKIIKSYAMVKESDIFNYFKGLGRKDDDDGEDCDVSKGEIATYNSNDGKKAEETEAEAKEAKDGKSSEKAEEADANHTNNAKAAETPLPVNPDINEKGILYIEYLGLAVVAAEPKSMEEQYLFVKQQIQKSRDMGFEVRGRDVMG